MPHVRTAVVFWRTLWWCSGEVEFASQQHEKLAKSETWFLSRAWRRTMAASYVTDDESATDHRFAGFLVFLMTRIWCNPSHSDQDVTACLSRVLRKYTGVFTGHDQARVSDLEVKTKIIESSQFASGGGVQSLMDLVGPGQEVFKFHGTGRGHPAPIRPAKTGPTIERPCK